MAGILGEYTELFLEESEDQIEELNSNLLLLEKDHHNQEIINDIFRAAHSLKSSAAFVGLYNLSDLSHKMENLLQKIREGTLEVNITLVNILFECFDLIKGVISKVANGEKSEEPFTHMIQAIEEYEKNPSTIANSSKSSSSASNKPNNDSANSANTASQKKESNSDTKTKMNPNALIITMDDVADIQEELAARPGMNPYKVRIILKADTPMKGLRFSLILQNLKNYGLIAKSKPTEEELESGSSSESLYFVFLSKKQEAEIHEIANMDMVETININRFKLPEAKKVDSKSKDSQAQGSSSSSKANANPQKTITEAQAIRSNLDQANADLMDPSLDKATTDAKIVLKSIKVSSDKLDQLLNNVGELVITNSGFQKIYDDLLALFGEDTLFNELKSKIDQINRISKDLQTGIMNIRMVPIGSVFNRFTRLVRDLSLDTGKKVNLVLRGENTELDKKVIDAIGEPLIHLIRNSVDHGIEIPQDRIKKGKPEEGTVELNAYQGGSNIMVEIRDDGRGLNKQKILDKAIKSGLVSKDDAQNLSDNDIYQFIFAPGFSTAEKVTDISGRGVGMSVVNKLIQEFKGKIIINSQEGVGSAFTLSFPQALAIIPSILVMMEEEVYAFPLSEVSETIKVNTDQITTLEGHEIINLRGEVLPIYRLNRIIGLAEKNNSEDLPVVIVNYKSRKLGFIVDDLIGKHETVIKSLAKNFRNVPGLTGATIMGDGTIILVLDIPGLVEIAAEDNENILALSGEMMKRVNTVRSLEITDTDYIFKTKLATNTFNSKLFDLRAKDKTKLKKDRQKVAKNREDRKIVVTREELLRENELENTEELVLNASSPVALESKSNGLPILEPSTSFSNEHTDSHSSSRDNGISTYGESGSGSSHSNANRSKDSDLPRKVESVSSSSKKSEDLYSHLESKVSDVDDEHKKKAAEIIQGFIEQKNQRIQAVESTSSKGIDELLNREQLRKLESVMNTGMMNAGMVLSQLVGKEVELFVPDISLTDKEGLAKDIRYSDENFFGMKIRMNGDLNGNLLMMFSEENGRRIASELLREKETSSGSSLNSDSQSVLSEISNIVCSGVINSLSNKSKSEILPSVPEFITGKFTEVLDIVKPERTKFLSMHTEFNHEGNNLLGILLFLPDFDELVELITKL